VQERRRGASVPRTHRFVYRPAPVDVKSGSREGPAWQTAADATEEDEMKLYRCITPTDRLCPCGQVARELKAAGIDFETERVGLSRKPEKRERIMELTSQPGVPVVVDDAGTAHHDSKAIIDKIHSGQIASS
jgi:glutathione S-transferase-like protein